MSRYDNEWGLPKLPGVISMTKVKNALKKHHPEITPKLSNIRVNGQLRGCSGFLTDTTTGKVVYISTEAGPRGDALYRTAEHDRDYRGGLNRFCDPAEIADEAVTLLKAGRSLMTETNKTAPESATSTPNTEILEAAAEKIVTEHDLERYDGESALHSLCWSLGDHIAYEKALEELVRYTREILESDTAR